jgi:hypothetical protein
MPAAAVALAAHMRPSDAMPPHALPQVRRCRAEEACTYDGREDAIGALQSQYVQDPGQYDRRLYYEAMCATGYGGNACGRCLDGFGSSGRSTCQK